MFYKWSLERACHALAEMGYHGLNVALEHPDTNPILLSDPKNASAVRKVIVGAGLEVIAVSYHIGLDLQTLTRTMDIALELGTNMIIINGDPTPSVGAKAQWPRTVERVKRVADVAERKDIVLAVEPDYVPGFTIASSAEFEQLAKEVNSPVLKLNMDINHAAKTDDDYLAALRRLADYLVHVHLSDSRNRVHEHLIPGQGDIDWKRLKSTFDEIGYTGYYVLDLFEDLDTPDVSARESLAAIKRLWEVE